ncbi:MAG: hypothetical protein N2444_07545 [Methylocystis sp.]|nr:hypothetical protein [Methylocystis sp.]
MARIRDARTTTHAETVWGAYRFDHTGDKRFRDSPWLLPLAFGVSIIGFAGLAAFAVTLTSSMQDHLVEDATADLEIFATAVSHELHDKIKTDAEKSLGTPLTLSLIHI